MPRDRNRCTWPTRGAGRGVAWPCLLLLASAATAAAQLPAARLYSVFPPGGAQGSSRDVRVTGADLDDAERLVFSHPDITAVPKTAPSELLEGRQRPVDGRFVVNIPAEVPPGIYEVRHVGKYGVSNPRAFVVTAASEIVETEPNNDAAKATPLSVGTVVSGRADSQGVDYFRFHATAGQRLLVDCWAARIDSRMDPTLVLYDATGRELAQARDTHGLDAMLDVTVPADGDYLAKVYDFLFRGGDEYVYRVSVSDAPYIDFVLPPAGQPGSTGRYTVYGRNIPQGRPTETDVDGRPLEALDVEIKLPESPPPVEALQYWLNRSDSAAVDGFPYRLQTPRGPSNAVLISLATAPVVLEQEPNDDPQRANPMEVPCEYAGQLNPAGDRDWLTFDAKKGDVYWIEVFSARLALPTDPFVLIQRVDHRADGSEQVADIQQIGMSAGANAGGVNFDTSTNDPSYRFAAPADGTYRVMIRDLYESGDPRFVYRLVIRRPRPDFRIVAVPRYPQADKRRTNVWSTLLRKGGTEMLQVVVLRRDGFGGPIRVHAENLPAGVSCRPIVIGPGRTACALVFNADLAATASHAQLRIVGEAQIGDRNVARRAQGGAVVWPPSQQNTSAPARLTRGIFLAVSQQETAPLLIESGGSVGLEMSRAGVLKVPVKITRRGKINGKLTLTAFDLPPNVQAKNVTVDAKKNDAEFPLTINTKAPLGTFSFYLKATAKVPYRRNPEAAERLAKESAEFKQLAARLNTAAQEAVETSKQAAEAAQSADRDALKATEQLTAAQAAMEQAEHRRASAQQRLSEATASESEPPTAEVITGLRQDLADATVAVNGARESLDRAAEHAATAKASAAASHRAAQEAAKASGQTAARKQATDKAAADAAKRAKAASDAAKEKNISIYEPSTPATFTITPAPITLGITAPPDVQPGTKAEVSVSVERLYGFDESVRLELIGGGKQPDVKAAGVTIPKGKRQTAMKIDVAKQAKPGRQTLSLRATVRFNKQNVQINKPLVLNIEPPAVVATAKESK